MVDETAVRRVLDMLAEEVRKTAAIVRLAEGGLQHVAEQTRTVPVHPNNPDPIVMVGPGDPNEPGVRPTGQLRRSELLRYAERRGQGAALLEQMWIVSTYSRWENHYRALIAETAGVMAAQVRSDLFGDLRHRRIDVVHHNATARRGHSGRTVLLPPIPDGQVVRMADDDFVIVSENISVLIEPVDLSLGQA